MSSVSPRVIPTEEPAPSPAPTTPQKRPTRHWKEIEIAILAQAFCRVSEDPLGPGSAQERTTLYNKVSVEFMKLSTEGVYLRTGKACESKWPIVQGRCSKWVGAVAYVTGLNRSGWDETQEYDEAQKVYKLRNEKPFSHILAFQELDKHEKWQDWSDRNKSEPEQVAAFDRQGTRRGAQRREQPMGHKKAKFAAAEIEATIKNIIDLDDEDEALTQLEKGRIAVGSELGVELRKSNDLIIMGKDLSGMDPPTAKYWQEQKDEVLILGKKRRDEAEGAASFATAGNVASDDVPQSEVHA